MKRQLQKRENDVAKAVAEREQQNEEYQILLENMKKEVAQALVKVTENRSLNLSLLYFCKTLNFLILTN